jgi:hypothetical protein
MVAGAGFVGVLIADAWMTLPAVAGASLSAAPLLGQVTASLGASASLAGALESTTPPDPPAAGVERFDLGQYRGRDHALGETVDTNQGRVADGVEDGVADFLGQLGRSFRLIL